MLPARDISGHREYRDAKEIEVMMHKGHVILQRHIHTLCLPLGWSYSKRIEKILRTGLDE